MVDKIDLFRRIALGVVLIIMILNGLIVSYAKPVGLSAVIVGNFASLLLLTCFGALVLISSKNKTLQIVGDVLILYVVSKTIPALSILLASVLNRENQYFDEVNTRLNFANVSFYIFLVALITVLSVTVIKLTKNITTDRSALIAGLAFPMLATLNLFSQAGVVGSPPEFTDYSYKTNLPITLGYIVLAAILMIICQSNKYVFWPAIFIFDVAFLYTFLNQAISCSRVKKS